MKILNSFILLFTFLSVNACTLNQKNIDFELLEQAALVRNNAQAPYSHFYVGSAVRSLSGTVYKGCNVERASYSQTTHGEQNAVDSMVAGEGPTKITALAVVAAPDSHTITLSDLKESEIIYAPMPSCCGHCLQIIWENSFNDKNVVIYFSKGDKKIYVTTIGQLLPYAFGPADLGIDYSKK